MRVVLRPRFAGWRDSLREHPAAARARAARTSRRSGATGSTTRGRATDRERAVPRRAAGARPAARPPAATLATGDRTQPISSGSSSASCCRATDPSDELRSGELDVAWAFHQRSSRPFVGSPGAAPGRQRRQTGLEHLAVQLGPRRSPGAPATSSFAARSRTGSTAPRSSGRYCGERRSLRSRARQRRVPGPEPLLPSRTGAPTAIDRRRPAGCSSRRAAAEEQTASTSAAGSASRLRFVTTAGIPARAQVLSLVQAQLRAGRGRGRAGLRSRRGVLQPDPPAGRLRRRALRVGRRPGCDRGLRHLRLRRRRRTTSGYCQRLVTRELDQADGSSTSASTRVS